MSTQPLSIDQFAAKIKAKYPDYASMDNGDLVNKIVAKYPDYKSQVDMSSSAPNAGLAGVARPNVNMQPLGDEDLMGNGMPSEQDMNPTADQHPVVTSALNRAGQLAKGAVMAVAKPPDTTAEKASMIAGPAGPIITRLIGGQVDAEKQIAPQVKEQFQAARNVPPGNPGIKALSYARAGTTALSALNPFATGSVANVNQLQDEGKPDQAAGEGITDALALGSGLKGPSKAISGVVGDSLTAAKTGLAPAADALNSARSTLAEKTVAALVRKPVGATMQDAQFGRNPAKAISDEGLVGSKASLPGKIQDRVGQLSDAIDSTLQNHPNANAIIDARPVIDSAIDNAVSAAEKTGNQAGVTRLENLRNALHTKYGPTQGTPFEINNFKRDVGQVASDLGAFKSTDPIEASAAGAMQDVYTGLKNAVNQHVPEVAPLNERIANLLSAQTGLKRNAALAENGSILDSHTAFSAGAKVAKNTIASAPVRTGVARVLNAGNTLDVPQVQPQIAQPSFIRGMLKQSPTITPPPADLSGSVPFNAPPVAATSRAQRLGFLLPESTSIPLGESTAEEGPMTRTPGKIIARDPKTGQAKTFFTNSSAEEAGPTQYQMAKPSFLRNNRRQPAASDLRAILDDAKASMSPEETTNAMFTDEKSGLPNAKAFNAAQPKLTETHPHVGFADIDDFKNFNTKLGEPEVDTKVFPAVGDAIKSAIAKENGSVHAFHVHGDEFNFLASDPAAVGRVIDDVNSQLKNSEFSVQKPDGSFSTVKGVGFSYGTGPDQSSAALAEKANKLSRKEAGLRVGSRDQTQDTTAGSTEGPAAGKQAPVNQNERKSVRRAADTDANQKDPIKPAFLRKKGGK